MVHTSESGDSDISEALLSASYHNTGPGGSDINSEPGGSDINSEPGGSDINSEPGGSDIIVALLSTSVPLVRSGDFAIIKFVINDIGYHRSWAF